MEVLKKSKLGILMTDRTIDVFKKTKADYSKYVISYAVAIIGTDIQLSLGMDFEPQNHSIEDEVDEIKFYWYCEKDVIEELKKYVVDKSFDSGSRAILKEEFGTG